MPKSALFSEPFSLNPNGKELKKKNNTEEISDCVNSFCKWGIQMAPAQKRLMLSSLSVARENHQLQAKTRESDQSHMLTEKWIWRAFC